MLHGEEKQPSYVEAYVHSQELRTRRGARVGGAAVEKAVTSSRFLPEVVTAYDNERSYLRSQVIGQDAAIDAIIEALDKSDVRRPDDHRPIANFAFLGPTGVGKTETATALSRALNPRDPHLLRIDCSNFSNGHEITTLIGSPPSYVGDNIRPLFAKEYVEHEGAVILFDEIEKGADQLRNLLLGIMDSGRLRLNNGEQVSFREAVIILTSNIGAAEMAKEAGGHRTGFSIENTLVTDEKLEAMALQGMREFFRPELINRLDSSIIFRTLDEYSLHTILQTKLDAINEVYREQFEAFISLTDGTRRYLVEQALKEKQYGVRPLVRAFEKQVMVAFGRHTASERVPRGSELVVHHRDELDDASKAGYKSELIFEVREHTETQERLRVEIEKAVNTDMVNAAYNVFQPPKDPV